MFRRHWSGLPKDVSYPADLEKLGYFINEEDEVRSVEDPDYYFKAFPDRNERVNWRHRFAFDHALEKIIEGRLEEEGLKKTPLPLGTSSDEKHVPIFMTDGLENKEKRRIVVFFGETSKPLGLLAGRVANGRGGINKGSLVSVVKYLHNQVPRNGDRYEKQPPGIILANVGQLYWYPDEKRALTVGASDRIQRRSLVDAGRRFVPEINQIKGHESPEQHILHIFEEVLPTVLGRDAKIDLIAVGDTCERVQLYLDQKEVWGRWGTRLSSMLLMDTLCSLHSLHNDGFKDFLAKRARNYILSSSPLDMPIAPPTGNESLLIKPMGVPSYSSSEPNYLECILITGMETILDYLLRNAMNPKAKNGEIVAIDHGPPQPVEEQETQEPEPMVDDEAWGKLPNEEKPSLSVFDPSLLDKQRRQNDGWEEYMATGQSIAKEALDGHTQ